MWWLWKTAVINAHRGELHETDTLDQLLRATISGDYADNLMVLGIMAIAICLFWLSIFYGASVTYSKWSADWPASTKAHENSKYWGGWYVMGTIHAILLSLICVPAVFALWNAPHAVQFGHTSNVGFCIPSEGEPVYEPAMASGLLWVCVAVAFAGLVFTCFICMDLIVALRHGLAAWDYLIHHAIFIFAAQMIRGYCMLPFNAAILMAMEVSTPFLNYYIYFRNRQGWNKTYVTIASHLFAATFFTFRVLINTYGAYYLWREFKTAMPPIVPEWQRWFLLIAFIAGAVIQWFWAYKVVQSILSPTAKEEEDGEKQPLKGQSV